MKKQLLFGSALLAAITAFSQNRAKSPATGIANMSEVLATKFGATRNAAESQPTHGAKQPSPSSNEEVSQPVMESGNLSAITSNSVIWKTIGGTGNIYGVLTSQSQPLTFCDNLNAVCMIHRKGGTMTTQPFSTTGSIIARITQNWGANWDSTCIWASDDNVMRARYPQGGIYNPATPSINVNINSAYAVGMGPITNGSGWTGDWYASKQLGSGNYNLTASNAPGAMQFIANTPPFAAGLAKHDFSRYSFAATDDGHVRSLADRYYGSDGNGNPQDFKGVAIVKGTFNSGSFTWTSDTILPSTIQSTIASNNLLNLPIMAWNESGTHGYVVFLGADNTYSANPNTPNRGWQPIVYKTTNSGGSWSQIQGIDFAAPSMSVVMDHIFSVNTNTALAIPFFKWDEGFDAVVDANNRLHFVSTLVGSARSHNDSLAYTYQFGTENYAWNHTPGLRPYIYDFIGDGSGPWSVIVIDSASTEGPSSTSGQPGYGSNPWDADPSNSNAKVTSDMRIQASRTPDGQYVMVSWAESDTAFTNNAVKWNSLANIKVRAMLAPQGTVVANYSLSPTEINLTRPTPTSVSMPLNPNVSNRAMFHYMSSTGNFNQCLGSNTVQLVIPFTVSNSNPYSQLTENRLWYTSAWLDFAGLTTCTGFQQNLAYNVNKFDVYPNPADSRAVVALNLAEAGKVDVSVYNMVGQLMQQTGFEGSYGDNTAELNLENLAAGMYIVNVKVGNTTSTKKLIIQ